MKIGDEVYIHGFIDEIRKDTIIIHNEGGYFGTIPEEVVTTPSPQQKCEDRAERDEKINDSISRQAVLDLFPNDDLEWDTNFGYIAPHFARRMIEELSSAQQWTPSGEKPPEKGKYLVWMPFAPPNHKITIAEYCGGYWNIKTPISAWMPLPKPYEVKK